MTTTFTSDIFAKLNLTLPASDQADFLQQLNNELQERIGLAIFDLLTDAEAEALIAIQEQGNDKAVTDWIQTNVPEYSEIVEDEYDILFGEIADSNALVTA
jgi:hypothetical protein